MVSSEGCKPSRAELRHVLTLHSESRDPVTYTWPAKIGEVLEIIWVNTGSLVHDNGGVDYHPFHAHGGHYYDIGSKFYERLLVRQSAH